MASVLWTVVGRRRGARLPARRRGSHRTAAAAVPPGGGGGAAEHGAGRGYGLARRQRPSQVGLRLALSDACLLRLVWTLLGTLVFSDSSVTISTAACEAKSLLDS